MPQTLLVPTLLHLTSISPTSCVVARAAVTLKTLVLQPDAALPMVVCLWMLTG